MIDYEVIIAGGGPVGMALAIELGMLGIKTAIIEKHKDPQMLPKAQLLNARSMEFFRRWGISKTLVSKRLLSADYPLVSVWCGGFAGSVYSCVDISENANPDLSPESYQRIPLWVTEAVLRERIQDFKQVAFFRECEVTHVEQQQDKVTVMTKHRKTGHSQTFSSHYLVGCDGANSLTRQRAGIDMHTELPALRMINVMFTSQDLKEKMTVPRGILYYNLTLPKPAAIGCVADRQGLWYAQITYPGTEPLSDIPVSDLLDEVAGFSFDKEIKQTGLWFRQAQIAAQFRKNRIFLAGDAAHILPPTGGHGLNTGLGDSLNLAWKLAAVLRHQASDKLLDSYEMERKPVALRNIRISNRNAQDAGRVREAYPLETMPQAFARENARIAKQHALTAGVALGYCYQQSPVILHADNNDHENNPAVYQPTALPGFFAPHVFVTADKCLYDLLPVHYTLLVTQTVQEEKYALMRQRFHEKNISLHTLNLSTPAINRLYQQKYYLLRPDWHIAWCGDRIPDNLETFIHHFMPE